MAGPIPVSTSRKQRLLASPLGVEGKILPRQDESAGKSGKWNKVSADAEGKLPLPKPIENGLGVHFAAFYVTSLDKREVVLILDSSSGLRAWMNGATVLMREPDKDGDMTHAEGLFTMPKGQSVILIGVGGKASVLKARFADAKGRPMTDLAVSTVPGAALNPRIEENPDDGRRWLLEGHPKNWRNRILSVVGEVVQISQEVTPAEIAPYTEAHFLFKYRVIKTTLGKCDQPFIAAAHWCLIDNKRTPATSIRVGEIHALDLDLYFGEYYDTHPEAQLLTLSDDLGAEDDPNVEVYMVLKWKKAK